MLIERITFKYLRDFQCIAAACPDTCCQGWGIGMNEDKFLALSHVMAGVPGGLSELSEKVITTVNPEGQKRHAIRLTGAGACQFLREDRLCSLHARFGAQILPQVCYHFPKIRYLVGQRWEVMASLACPETARLCLLDPHAMNIVDIPDLPGQPACDDPSHCTRIDIHHSRPYFAHFDKVRGVLFVLGSLDRFPIASKLFMACYFASHIESFFHANQEDPMDHLLEQEIAMISSPTIRQQIHEQFTAIQFPRQKCFEFVTIIMNSGYSHSASRDYSEMLARAMRTYGATMHQGVCSVPMERIVEQYFKIKEFWQQEFGQELDQYQSHYFLNHIMGVPYLHNANPLVYLRGVLIALAVIKFILFGLLGCDPTSVPPTREERKKRLEETMVDTVQKFSKAIYHTPALLGQVERKLDEQGVTTLPHMFFLLQF